jgi:hypothetical protein
MRRSFRFSALGFGAVALAAGCSLVNSLDDVKPADDGKFTGDTRPPATGVVVEDAGFGPTTASTADAESEASTAEEFSPIVVGGEASVADSGALTPVLTVIDSKTGRERGQRETMWVAGIAHDDLRDLWYIFEAPNYFVATPTETVKIHTRRLDSKTGQWTELAVFEGPPLVYYDEIAVTRERISYVAHPLPGDAGTKNRLITLSTSDPASTVVTDDATLLDELPRGMTATPSPTGPGGNLSLINVGTTKTPGDCEALDGGGTRCKVRIRHYLVPNAGVPQALATTLVGGMSSFGAPGCASVTCGGGPDDVIVQPGVGVEGNGIQTITTADYVVGTETGSIKFNMSTAVGSPTLLRRAAIDNPRRIVFVVEANNDTALYAIPLSGAGAQKINLRHSGQSVYYDPASETAFAPFNQGEGKTFSAIKVSAGKDGADLTLKDRFSSENVGGDWDPPSDLHPNILGIRLTGSNCP